MVQFRVHFCLGDITVSLHGTYEPPAARGEGLYGHFRVTSGHVVAQNPVQIALADNLEGHSIDAIVGRAMQRIGRATW